MNRYLERHRNIIDFALSSLLRRKAKNISLLIVYTLVVFMVASIIFFVQSMKREAKLILENAPDIVVQRMIAGRHDLIPTSYGDTIAGIRGVREVRPRLWGYYYDPVFSANYTFMAAASNPPDPGLIVIGSGVARTVGVEEGDMMTFRSTRGETTPFLVQRVLPHASELAAADLIITSDQDFRAFFDFPDGKATDLAITVGNRSELGTIANKILGRFPDTRPILKSEILRTYDSVFDWRGGIVIVILAAAVLSFIIFAWDKATGLSAEERKEIGILKSIGWETSDVLLLKSWEGIIISLSSFLAGVILAYCHIYFFSASLFSHALKGWSVLYPQFRLMPVIDAYQIAILFFLTVVPYATATVIPSWRTATIDPDAAMRS